MIEPALRPRRRVRRLVAVLVSGLVAVQLVLTPGLLTGPARADDGAPAFGPIRTVSDSALSDVKGKHPAPADAVDVVGVDPGLSEAVLFNHQQRVIYRLDTKTLVQDGPGLDSQYPPADFDGGVIKSSVPFQPNTNGSTGAIQVDPDRHVVYLGARPSASSACTALQLACVEHGSFPTPTSIGVVDLVNGSTGTYTFPSAFDGLDVIALRPVTAGGRHLLLALLYLTVVTTGESENVKDLQLVALDADRMLTAPGTALLWSYAVPQCMSTPSWTVGKIADFLGVDPGGRFAYFACRGFTSTTGLDPLQPAGAIVVDLSSAFGLASDPSAFTTTFYPFGANMTFSISGGDQARSILLLASTGSPNKIYIFDAQHLSWVGSVPFVPSPYADALDAVVIDPSNGVGYGVYDNTVAASFPSTSVPSSQGTSVSYGDFLPAGGPAVVDPTSHTLLLTRDAASTFSHADRSPYPTDVRLAAFTDDREPPPADTEPDPDDQTTHDRVVAPDAPVDYRGFASGYGTRITFLGGVHSLPALPVKVTLAQALGVPCTVVAQVPPIPGEPFQPSGCFGFPAVTDSTRVVTLGSVGKTESSSEAANVDASPVVVDTGTLNDVGGAFNYNPEDLVNPVLPPHSPPLPAPPSVPKDVRDQATAPVDAQSAPAQCLVFGSDAARSSTPGASASCDMGSRTATGAAAVPAALNDSPVQVAYTGSSTSASEVNGASITQVASVARGISIAVPGGPTVRIGEVLATATTQAGGRRGTATSSFTRRISGVTVSDGTGTVFSCGFRAAAEPGPASEACDPRQLSDVVTSLSEFPVLFLTPAPDGDPRVSGSPWGAQAEVIKSKYQYWNDFFTNGDNGGEIPGLEVVLVGDGQSPSRLVTQFAGVEAESHYVIGVAPPKPPALPAPTLKLTLTDGATPPAPLSGGTFTIQGPGGAAPTSCTTAADGVGTCALKDLAPGAYTVHEATAPPGYAPAPDYTLALDRGHDYAVTFVNLPAIGSVHVTLSAPDAASTPLSGGSFSLFKGTDTLASPIATCTTDGTGGCDIDKVPLGDYTMTQSGAPDGYLVSDPSTFSISQPGQRVVLAFVDGTPSIPPVPPTVIPGAPPVPPQVIPGKPAVPPRIIPGKPAVPPHAVELPATDLLGAQPAAFQTSMPPPVVSETPAVAAGPQSSLPLVLGAPGNVVQLPVRLARLAFHTPRQAALLLVVWLLLGLPAYLWVRRRQFLLAVEGS